MNDKQIFEGRCVDWQGRVYPEVCLELRKRFGRSFPPVGKYEGSLIDCFEGKQKQQGMIHDENDHCAVCGKRGRLELHHIFGGSRGRKHYRTNMILLCGPSTDKATCHGKVTASQMDRGLIIWRKWRVNPDDCDWFVLALIAGHNLPDLVIDRAVEQRYREKVYGRSKR